jgi:hypothetical protein
MELRSFFQLLREAEAAITSEHVVVASEATPDGGKAGIFTEVSRANAARLIVERRARLATADESAAFLKKQEDSTKIANLPVLDPRMPIAIFSEPEIRQLRDKLRPQKG